MKQADQRYHGYYLWDSYPYTLIQILFHHKAITSVRVSFKTGMQLQEKKTQTVQSRFKLFDKET